MKCGFEGLDQKCQIFARYVGFLPNADGLIRPHGKQEDAAVILSEKAAVAASTQKIAIADNPPQAG